MKKILTALIAVAMIFQTVFVFAAQPSGIKDTAGNREPAAADIEVQLNTAQNGMVLDKDISYLVRLKASSESDSAFRITTECGGIITSDSVTLPANGAAEKSYVFNNCPIGENIFSVKVECNGTLVNNYSKKLMVAPAVPRYFLDEVTTKTGYNWIYEGAYSQEIFPYANGSRTTRSHMGEWRGNEKSKGVFDFSASHNDPTIPYMDDLGVETILMLGYYNEMYNESGSKNGPDSKGYFDGFANYGRVVAERYPDVRNFEVWNEANGGFWSNPNFVDYAYLSEITNYEIKRVNPDARIITGATAHSDAGFTQGYLEQEGVWANIDSVSYHPYTAPSLADDSLFRNNEVILNVIMQQGGWKIPICSEVGWPSNNRGRGVTREQQAIELAKSVIMEAACGVPLTIIHSTFDSSWDDTASTEAHYGIMRQDGTPKPSLYSTREANNQLNGAVYAGMVTFPENPDIQFHMFARDNKVHAAAWTKGEPTDISMGSDNVSVYDMNGNPCQNGNTVSLGEKPVYIHGLSPKWVADHAVDYMNDFLGRRIGLFDDVKDAPGFDKAKELIYTAAERAERVKAMDAFPTEEEALALLNEHYDISKQIIDMYKEGKLEIPFKRLTGLLDLNHWLGLRFENIYMLAANSNYNSADLGGRKALDSAKDTMDAKRGERTLSGAEAIWKYAKQCVENVEKIDPAGENAMKNGYVKAEDKMGQILSEQAVKLSEAEKVGSDNVLIQLPSSVSGIDLGKEQDVNFSVYNYRATQPITGHVEVEAPDGTVFGKSDEFTLKAGESAKIPVKVQLDQVYEGKYLMKIYENGEEIVSRQAPLKVKEQLKVSFAPMMKTFDEIESITVDLENVYGADIEGEISVEPRCNWTLGTKTQKYSVADGEKVQVTYPVTSKEKEPFNFYTFDIVVKNQEGREIYRKYLPIDFTVVSKSDKEMNPADFTGDISDWSDAYPIYMDTPQDPENYDEWMNEDAGARMMMKWDENYYYMMCDVFDQYHANMQTSSLIWNGDSIQLAWDTLNDKTPSVEYQPDDIEYGVALVEGGTNLYQWAPNGLDVDSSWGNVMRNNDTHLTRYFIRIPAEGLAPLEFKEDKVFGFNFLLNDSDFTTREKSLEYRWGISFSKDTSTFEDFRFVGVESRTPGEPKIPIPLNFEPEKKAESGEAVSFRDMEGHWAEEWVNTLAEKGIVRGTEPGIFEPERLITRAEFVTELVRAAGENPGDTNRPYYDVPAGTWFTGTVAKAKEKGWIPAEMAEGNFYPDRNINREEAFYITNCYLKEGKLGDASYKSLLGFSDASEVSPWAAESIQNLWNHGVIDGEDAALKPAAELTRAEAAKIIAEVFAMRQ